MSGLGHDSDAAYRRAARTVNQLRAALDLGLKPSDAYKRPKPRRGPTPPPGAAPLFAHEPEPKPRGEYQRGE